MGLQWYDECFCGNSYGSSGPADGCGELGIYCGSGEAFVQNNPSCTGMNAVYATEASGASGWLWACLLLVGFLGVGTACFCVWRRRKRAQHALRHSGAQMGLLNHDALGNQIELQSLRETPSVAADEEVRSSHEAPVCGSDSSCGVPGC